MLGERRDFGAREAAHLRPHGVEGVAEEEIELSLIELAHDACRPMSYCAIVRQNWYAPQALHPMSALRSALDPRSPEFQRNRAAMQPLVADLQAQVARTALGGGEAARARHRGRGKLLPRERIDLLLDPGARSSSSRSSPRMACTATRRLARAWSPGSVA